MDSLKQRWRLMLWKSLAKITKQLVKCRHILLTTASSAQHSAVFLQKNLKWPEATAREFLEGRSSEKYRKFVAELSSAAKESLLLRDQGGTTP